MDSSGAMGYMQRFQDEGYKTWIKTTMILECLKTRLGGFLESETDAFHKTLKENINVPDTECRQRPKCEFKNFKQRPNQGPQLCRLCGAWRDAIWAKHTSKQGQVYWNNSTPHLWPSQKWEVAKVYMSRGNKNHQSVDDFDISAFLNLMNFCGHFRSFVKSSMLNEVTNVRNRVMHSASFQVSAEDFQQYVGRIRALGQALGEKVPEFQSFSEDMAKVQNIDFSLHFQGLELQANNTFDSRTILDMELKIMKDKMECLAQLYDVDNMLTSEELQKVRGFLDSNHDLQEKLKPQFQRLEAVQAQQGQEIHTLTGRVGELEKQVVTTDVEFSTETSMYKNRLLERARRYKWPVPIFSERDESTGFKGQVEVNGKIFLGSQVCRSKIQAHQEVAKIALQELDSVMANEEAASGQADQSQTVSQGGPTFFAAVTVSLTVDVSPDKCDSVPVDRVESAYEKLVCLFGLKSSDTGSSNKENVLQYCSKLNVPPPVERSSSDRFVLRLNGQITFFDLEGSKRKAQAEQQAAKAALEVLCGVLDTAEVFQDNHKGALKELLERFKQAGKPDYRVTESPGGRGERVTWLPGEDLMTGQTEGRPDGGHGNEEGEDGEEGALAAIVPPLKRMWTPGSNVPSKITKVLLLDGNDLTDGGRFLGSVQVTIQVDLRPCQAADQEGAVGAAYSDLMKALSLSPASRGGERQAVLEFLKLTQCRPPVEEITSTSGTHQCALKIDGQFTFHSPERTSTKREAEQLAAQEALAHLEGLQTVTDIKLPGEDNYKSRLQEVVVRLGNMGHPVYHSTDGGEGTDGGRFLGSVQVTIQVDLRPHQEGAVGAAYSDLMKALSLSPESASGGGERQAVLEFLELSQCRPPVEEMDTSGTHQCLKIDGQFTFHSPERSSTKKEAEKLAARQALRHLEGLLSVNRGLLPGGANYKNRLQELLMARLGTRVVPAYLTIDGNDPHH